MIDLLHNQIIKQRSTVNFDYFEDIEDIVSILYIYIYVWRIGLR